MISRRHALKSAGALALAMASSPLRTLGQAASGPHKLPPLGYAFDALEPYIDAKTMEIHHGKHHQAYVTKLNEALADHPDLQKMSVEDLLKNLGTLPRRSVPPYATMGVGITTTRSSGSASRRTRPRSPRAARS